jgi:hypothetical protein
MAIAEKHHLPFRARVSKRSDEGREHHIEQREHGHQRRRLPLGRAARAQQFNGHHKQRVVSQRAEKLRRHDGVEAAFHAEAIVGEG